MSISKIPRKDVGGAHLAGLVALFTINLPDKTMLRFTTADVAAGHIVFDGARYLCFPLAAKGFRWTADGPPAHPTLEVSNILGLFDQAIQTDEMRGCEVRRILTLASELAPPDGEDGRGCFPPESWVIERLARLDDRVLRIELAAAASLENRRFPDRVMLRNLCQHRYRRWDAVRQRFDYDGVTCPYVGKSYFSQAGTPVTNPEEDHCSLTLQTGCKKRFKGPLPFMGFPGVTR